MDSSANHTPEDQDPLIREQRQLTLKIATLVNSLLEIKDDTNKTTLTSSLDSRLLFESPIVDVFVCFSPSSLPRDERLHQNTHVDEQDDEEGEKEEDSRSRSFYSILLGWRKVEIADASAESQRGLLLNLCALRNQPGLGSTVDDGCCSLQTSQRKRSEGDAELLERLMIFFERKGSEVSDSLSKNDARLPSNHIIALRKLKSTYHADLARLEVDGSFGLVKSSSKADSVSLQRLRHRLFKGALDAAQKLVDVDVFNITYVEFAALQEIIHDEEDNEIGDGDASCDYVELAVAPWLLRAPNTFQQDEL